jgi:hypothetical protein
MKPVGGINQPAPVRAAIDADHQASSQGVVYDHHAGVPVDNQTHHHAVSTILL